MAPGGSGSTGSLDFPSMRPTSSFPTLTDTGAPPTSLPIGTLTLTAGSPSARFRILAVTPIPRDQAARVPTADGPAQRASRRLTVQDPPTGPTLPATLSRMAPSADVSSEMPRASRTNGSFSMVDACAAARHSGFARSSHSPNGSLNWTGSFPAYAYRLTPPASPMGSCVR